MIHVEPTPCGRWMIATSLQSIGNSIVLLTAKRTIQKAPGEAPNDSLDRLAEEVIADLMGQMAQLGFSTERIMRSLDDVPELSFEKRKRA